MPCLTLPDGVVAGSSARGRRRRRPMSCTVRPGEALVTWLDRLLQRWRIRVALRELPRGARVLDIGTHDGTLFRLADACGVGIDPELAETAAIPGVTLVKGF